MSLDSYLREKGVQPIEGHSQNILEQQQTLRRFARQTTVQTILEIGFNAGHSSELFLSSNPTCQVVSFDLGEHPCVQVGKEYIDKTYPGRHTLILGNSVRTVPEFETESKYDLIFIDGGHDTFVAIADVLNCRRFAHSDTLVFMDDTVYTRGWEAAWTVGPTLAWTEAIKNGIVKGIAYTNYQPGRGMSWGTYV